MRVRATATVKPPRGGPEPSHWASLAAVVSSMAMLRADSDCVFCGRPTDAPPYTPPRTVLTYREAEGGSENRVQMPRTVTLCERCTRDRALLAGCPRCRRYGKFPPYAHSPYGSFCDDCGGRLYLLSGDDPVR